MIKQNIFVTGGRGYLASKLIQVLETKNNIIAPNNDIRMGRFMVNGPVDSVIHFACPSEIPEFKDKKKTATTIIDGTINIVNLCIEKKARLIFASSKAVEYFTPSDIYSTCKLAMENYIAAVCPKYTILRIPRVYSKCRKKGLMKKLRAGKVPKTDMGNLIQYITLNEFISQTITAIRTKRRIYHYDVVNSHSIRDIKNMYA